MTNYFQHQRGTFKLTCTLLHSFPHVCDSYRQLYRLCIKGKHKVWNTHLLPTETPTHTGRVMKLTVLLCSALLLSFCGLSLQKNKCVDGEDCLEPKKPPLEDIDLPDDDLHNVPHCKDRHGTHFCMRAYEPVCGSDGVTYFSRCDLCRSNRSKLREVIVLHNGEC